MTTQTAIRSNQLDASVVDTIGGWFPQKNRIHLAELIEKHEVRTAVEIGSFLGLSAAWLAQRVDWLICIDPWEETARMPGPNNLVQTLRDNGLPNPFFEIFRANMIRAGVWHKISPYRGKSLEMAHWVPDVDLIYLDGDHENCGNDIACYIAKARKVICGDDYHLDPNGRPYFPEVRASVDLLLPKHQSDDTFWWYEFPR